MKILCTIIAFLIFQLSVCAQILPDSFHARTPQAMNYKTLKSGEIITLEVVDTGVLSDELGLNAGDKVKIKILQYCAAKKGKRNGYFKIQYITEQKIYDGTMRADNPFDVKDIAEGAAVGAAGYVLKIPGLSQAVAVSKGLIAPNENQTRIESAEKNLYESTPLKYTERGEEFSVQKDGYIEIKVRINELN